MVVVDGGRDDVDAFEGSGSMGTKLGRKQGTNRALAGLRAS